MRLRTWYALVTVASLAGLAALFLFVAGCGDARFSLLGGDAPKKEAPAAKPGPTAPVKPDALSAAGWKQKAADLQEDIDADNMMILSLQDKVANAERAKAVALKNEDIQRDAEWAQWGKVGCLALSAMFTLLSLAGLAMKEFPVLSWLPGTLNKFARGFGIFAAGFLVLAFLIAPIITLVKWSVFIGVILLVATLVAALAYGVWWMIDKVHAEHAVNQAVKTGDEALRALRSIAPEVHTDILSRAIDTQNTIGVQERVDDLLTKARTLGSDVQRAILGRAETEVIRKPVTRTIEAEPHDAPALPESLTEADVTTRIIPTSEGKKPISL